MPISNYGVLRAHATAGRVVSGSSAHYQVTVDALDAAGTPLTIAINIESVDGSEVLYAVESSFQVPSATALAALTAGVTALQSEPDGLALDFVRELVGGKPLISRSQMALLPVASSRDVFQGGVSAGGNGETAPALALSNAVATLIQDAIAQPDSVLYAFGSAYADGGVVDGIHDIHMNQGNPLNSHANENGIWQDGAVFVHFPTRNSWTALFLAFQTESWHTDDAGNPAAAS